jgi:hypothetical protein
MGLPLVGDEFLLPTNGRATQRDIPTTKWSPSAQEARPAGL